MDCSQAQQLQGTHHQAFEVSNSHLRPDVIKFHHRQSWRGSYEEAEAEQLSVLLSWSCLGTNLLRHGQGHSERPEFFALVEEGERACWGVPEQLTTVRLPMA